MINRILIAMLIPLLVFGQTEATRKTKEELLESFRDGQPRNSITPRKIRDLTESAMSTAFPSVTQFGACGNDVCDDTAAIQACIDAVPASGGTCYFPRGSYKISESLIIRSDVRLLGESSGFRIVNNYSTRIFGNGGSGDFPIISDGGVATQNVAIESLYLRGTSSSGSRGIYAPITPIGWRVRDVNFNTFGDECMKIGNTATPGIDGLFEANFGDNCVLVRTGRLAYIGALDIAVHDARILHNEFTASIYDLGQATYPGQGLIGDGYIAAVVNRGTNTFVYGNIGQISQVGFVQLSDGPTQFIGNRADLNQGAGFIFPSYSNTIIGNHAFRNSMTADGAYPGFLITGGFETITDNRISQLSLDDGSTGHPRQGYGFTDSGNGDSTAAGGNYYRGNRVQGTANGLYNFSGSIKKVVVDSAGSYDAAGANQGPGPAGSWTGLDKDDYFVGGGVRVNGGSPVGETHPGALADGLIGEINVPSSANFTGHAAGLAGRARTASGTLGAIGVYGSGIAAAGATSDTTVWGANFMANNQDLPINNPIGVEIDINHSGDGPEDAAQGAIGLLITGASNLTTVNGQSGVLMWPFSGLPGETPSPFEIPWTNAFETIAGTATVGLKLGPKTTDDDVESQDIRLVNADGGSPKTARIFTSADGDMFLVTDITGGNNGMVLNGNGRVDAEGGFATNGTAGLTQTVVVKGSDGNNCNLVFSGGLLTSETCP